MSGSETSILVWCLSSLQLPLARDFLLDTVLLLDGFMVSLSTHWGAGLNLFPPGLLSFKLYNGLASTWPVSVKGGCNAGELVTLGIFG